MLPSDYVRFVEIKLRLMKFLPHERLSFKNSSCLYMSYWSVKVVLMVLTPLFTILFSAERIRSLLLQYQCSSGSLLSFKKYSNMYFSMIYILLLFFLPKLFEYKVVFGLAVQLY